MFGYSQLCLVLLGLLGYVRLCEVVLGVVKYSVGLCWGMLGYVRAFFVRFVFVGLCQVLGYVRSCWVMFGNFWLCLAMFGHVGLR